MPMRGPLVLQLQVTNLSFSFLTELQGISTGKLGQFLMRVKRKTEGAQETFDYTNYTVE